MKSSGILTNWSLNYTIIYQVRRIEKAPQMVLTWKASRLRRLLRFRIFKIKVQTHFPYPHLLKICLDHHLLLRYTILSSILIHHQNFLVCWSTLDLESRLSRSTIMGNSKESVEPVWVEELFGVFWACWLKLTALMVSFWCFNAFWKKVSRHTFNCSGVSMSLLTLDLFLFCFFESHQKCYLSRSQEITQTLICW